jgi:hypothetical protein
MKASCPDLRLGSLTAILVALSVCLPRAAHGAQELLPWQRWIERANPDQVKPLDDLMAAPWENSGGKEGSLTRSEQNGPWGGPYLRFHVKIDHLNEGKYPLGWPSFQHKPPAPLDLSGWDALQYWIRCDRGFDHPATLRFILHTGGKGVVNEYIQPSPGDEWVQMTRKIRDLPNIDKVTLIHFFLCENEYAHEEEMTFEVGGLRLCNLTREVSKLGANEAAMALYVGERGDTSDEAVILDQDAATLPLLMVFETGERASFDADAQVRLTFREVFSGWETSFTQPLGAELPAGETTRVTAQADLAAADLRPGYYSVIADLLGADGSVLGGRVGSDDLYVRAPDESMTYTVLSIRTGMALWVRDLLHGDIMCRTDIHLPHSYDPLSEQTYADFLRVFAHTTGKHTEGNEAGDTGLVFAAEAFRKSGHTSARAEARSRSVTMTRIRSASGSAPSRGGSSTTRRSPRSASTPANSAPPPARPPTTSSRTRFRTPTASRASSATCASTKSRTAPSSRSPTTRRAVSATSTWAARCRASRTTPTRCSFSARRSRPSGGRRWTTPSSGRSGR